MRWVISLLLLIVLSSRGFCTPATALHSSAEYARKNPTVMPYTRFFDLSCYPENYREEILKVLAFQLNSISTEPEIAVPKVISAEVVLINYLEYSADDEKGKNRFRDVWEKLEDVDVYGHQRDYYLWNGGFDKRFGKDVKAGRYFFSNSVLPIGGNQADLDYLKLATHSNVPIIRADFWLAQVARQINIVNKANTGTGYYDFIGVKKRADFEKLVAFKEADSIAVKKEIRAAVKDSGVAQQNRGIVRFQSLTGGYWVTLDTDDSTGRGNIIENPDRLGFVHKAEEIYGVLPNGLFAYWLGQADGTRQDTAPDFIGPDDSDLRLNSGSRDGRIHVNLSCVRCHTFGGLKPISDWYRNVLRQPLAFQSPDKDKFYQIRRQYFSNLDSRLDLDRAVFVDSVRLCNGLTVPENAKAFSHAFDFYTRSRGPSDIARDLGIKEEILIICLKAYAAKTGQLDLILSGLLQTPPESIKIQHYEELQPLLREIVK